MMRIVHILCEGPTEERFVAKVLKQYLSERDILAKPILLSFNEEKNVGGGVSKYSKIKEDFTLMFHSYNPKDGEFEKHYYTTMLDLFRLPADVPGNDESLSNQALLGSVEKAFEDDISSIIPRGKFIPYIQYHEFEALVFCGIDALKSEYPKAKKSIEELKAILLEFDNQPENINSRPDKAPSKRLISTFLKQRERYDKVRCGVLATSSVGVDKLRELCPHFDEWIGKLEKL